MIEEAVVLVPRTKSRQMRMMTTPQGGGENVVNIRRSQEQHQQGAARGAGGDQQLVFGATAASGAVHRAFPPRPPTNPNSRQIGDVVIPNFDKPKPKPKPKPISRSKSLQPVHISLELPKGAYEMMRQVSGLGMEDPVFGLSNHSMVRAAGKSIPIIFDDMKLTDLPEDMQDLISVCSDPTASLHKDRSLHKRIRMAQMEQALQNQNSSSRISKLLSTTSNNMDVSADNHFLLSNHGASTNSNNNTRVGRMLSTTTTNNKNNNNRKKVVSPVRQRKEGFAHPFVPPQSIYQLTESERQPKKELDIFRKKAKPKATSSKSNLPTAAAAEVEKPSDRRWRKSNIAEQLNNQQQQLQRRSGKEEDDDDEEVQIIIPSFPSKKKSPTSAAAGAAKETLNKDNLNNQNSENWQSFFWDDSRNNLDSSARHNDLLDSSARHNTKNNNEQSVQSFWEESQRSRLHMSNILDMSNNLDRSNKKDDTNDELLLDDLFAPAKVPTTNPQRRSTTHIQVSKLSTMDNNLFNGARGGRAATSPPSRSNDFSGMELCVPSNLYFARSISGLTLDTSHGPLDDSSVQKRKPASSKMKTKLKQHLEEGEAEGEQQALIADLLHQSHQISLTLSELAKSTHHSRRSSQNRNSSNDITGASSRLSYSATEVGDNFFNHQSHNTHNTHNSHNTKNHHHHSSRKDKNKRRLSNSLDNIERKTREENYNKSRGRSKTSNKMDLIKEDSNARLARHSEEKAKARRRSYSLESTHSKTKLGNVSHRRSSNQKGMPSKTYSQDTAQRMLAFGNASLKAAEKANEIKANLTRYHRKSSIGSGNTSNKVGSGGGDPLTTDSRPSSKRFSTFHASMAHMITAKDNSNSNTDDDLQVMGNKSCGDLDFMKAMDSLMSESMHQHH